MKLTEERKTHIIGGLLSLALVCQIVQSIAGGKQQDSYNQVNWLVGHSNKSLALLSNLMGLTILDAENRSQNFENYRQGLSNTHEQHQKMSVEESRLLKEIVCWGQVERVAGMLGFLLVASVMYLYLKLIVNVSGRIK